MPSKRVYDEDYIARILLELMGDAPCNFGDISDWLTLHWGCIYGCDADPVECWKAYLRYHWTQED